MQPELVTIQQTINRRVSAILAERGDWFCRKGCADCCRNLASIPEMTAAEWELLQAGWRSLPKNLYEGIANRLGSLEAETRSPIICPFLDRATGACLVYEWRPLACRTYGFYVEREAGLYCNMIRASADRGELADVVWGNQTTIDAESQKLGPVRTLVEWARVELPAFKPGSNGD